MIPRTIHYCWFGGAPLPPKERKCIESWRKYCPGYEIREWNERNFDVNALAYTREAYEAKKWAFVSDVCRLHALVECGGVYLDTDAELVKPLDDLLGLPAFTGFEDRRALTVQMSVLGAERGAPAFRELLDGYRDRRFLRDGGAMDLTTITEAMTRQCVRRGLRGENSRQSVQGLEVFPSEWFSPMRFRTGRLQRTRDTYAIHHFVDSWHGESERRRGRRRRILCRLFGERLGLWINKKLGLFLRGSPIAWTLSKWMRRTPR